MNKIQIFASTTVITLQTEINQWLSANKDVHIIETNLTSLAKVNVLGSGSHNEGEYAFYILYTPIDQGEEESVLQASLKMPAELTDLKVIENESN